ncbi:Hcp family type VI secretion system effector [Vagococcus sp. WN89Y]|uniref:Hcp family type VI secretion system effector n=1 Tax=Vagococcus sp. WN89Y TaxID=3457258 RepID=UPI003FCD94D0
MSNIIYLSITGDKQGLISSGCSAIDSVGNKFQMIHKDEIIVYEVSNTVRRDEQVAMQPLQIRKPIDKSTPLLAQALGENEKLECVFSFYRTASYGGNEFYFKMTLKDAIISNINFFHPNAISHNEIQPYEGISFKFSSIMWEHVTAKTSSCLLWEDAVC